MGTIPIPSGATIDDPSQTPTPSGGIPIPQGATIDAAPTGQIAAGQGAIGPKQVAAGAGATGPGDVLAGLNEYIDKQAAPFWDSADRAHDALQTALGHFEDHLKNLAAGVAGIKRLPAQAPTTPTVKPTPEATPIWQSFQGDTGLNKLADHVIAMEGDSRIARENNNPGNLKNPRTGELQKFGSYDEGRQALIKQLGRWRDKNPDWSIADFNRNYAPDRSHGGDNPEGTEESRNQHLMNVSTQVSVPTDPPPGFILEPKPEDFESLPADVRAAQKAGKYLEPAAKVVGGMASSALRVSMPYIAWQMYKKATGQPNELNKIPGDAIKQIGILLAGGAGEAAAPEAVAAEAPAQAPAETPPQAPPKQLGMGAIEGEYLLPEVRGQLPPGQYAQPPVQQSALPPGQYAPPAPATRLALPERASPIPLPETFPGPREPIIRTTPSEPLPPLRTTPEEAPTKEAPAKKGRAPRPKPAAQPAAKATPEAQPAAERTAVGTEGQVKGMRLVQRGNKWYDARTGEEYKWRVRTN